jgi:hypothetical protein
MKTKSLIALVLSTVGLVSTTHAEQSGRGVNKLQRWLPFCFSDRVTDGCDQSALVTGKQEHSTNETVNSDQTNQRSERA